MPAAEAAGIFYTWILRIKSEYDFRLTLHNFKSLLQTSSVLHDRQIHGG
jgi:hypothetical protein